MLGSNRLNKAKKWRRMNVLPRGARSNAPYDLTAGSHRSRRQRKRVLMIKEIR